MLYPHMRIRWEHAWPLIAVIVAGSGIVWLALLFH